MEENYLISHNFTMTPFLIFDSLIIGSGVAGLSAAITASKFGRVLIISKGEPNQNNSYFAQGGVASVLKQPDNFDSHIQDTLTAGAGLCNKKAVQTLVEEGPKRIKELIKWGINFDKDRNQKLNFTTEGGHTHRRILHAGGDATGKELISALRKKVASIKNIHFLHDHFLIDLLHHENVCYGALAYDTSNKKKTGILAKQTILATGGSGCVYQETTNPHVATGDGAAIGFRAGANLAGLEFMQFHPTTFYVAGAPRFLISEAVRGEGGILRDQNGQAFMSNFHPLKDLAPRDIVSKAISSVMLNQNINHVYLDVTHVDAKKLKSRFPNITKFCQTFNINIAKDFIPVRPSAHYHMGGIITDLHGKTNITNLYACGEVSHTGCHGANRLASNSLLEALVFGHRAGAKLESVINKKIIGFPLDQIKTIQSSKNGDSEVDLNDMLLSVRSLMWKKVGVFKDKSTLHSALKQIKAWGKTLTRTELREPKHFELANIMTIAQLITTNAIRREESRGAHQRADFPNSLKKENKNILINKANYPDVK